MSFQNNILRRYLFNGKEFYKVLLSIALPIVIQNLIGTALNLVDTIMIGQVGMAQIAAVGIANQYYLLYSILVLAVFSGCGVFISQFWGKGDKDNIGKVVGAGMIGGAGITFVFAVLAIMFPANIIKLFNNDPVVVSDGAIYLKIIAVSYFVTMLSFGFSTSLRSIGKSVVPMFASVFAILINTCLNYILIFGHFGIPKMGVAGAAIATLIARVIEAIIVIIYVYSYEKVLEIRMRHIMELTVEFIQRLMKTVVPVMLNEACWAIGFVSYTAVYGRIGTHAVASVQISSTIQNIFTVAAFGLANASAVMIGHKIGAGEEAEGREQAWRFTFLSWAMGIMLGLALAVCSSFILKGFNASGDVYNSALQLLYLTALIMPVRMFNIVAIVGILRGGGDAKFAFIFEASTMWLIGVPMAVLGAFVFKLPVQWVVALVMLEEIVKFSFGLARLISRKWIRNVIHGL